VADDARTPVDVTHFASASGFRRWLEANHEALDVLWVGYWKKETGRPGMTWEESVDEALCFGWIDGIRKRVDDQAYTIRFTPRRSSSTWSRRNIDRYRELAREGRVAPAGRAAWGRRSDERSGVYSFEQVTPSALPEAYLERIRALPAAWADWEARPPGYRRQVTHWVMSARREETRERRLVALIEDCAAGRKVKPLR
jgi:uncharacterized protein YdeI (YjbR/CyaY-like superfamily)